MSNYIASEMFPELRRRLTPAEYRTRLETLPEGERLIIIRVWECADRYYKNSSTVYDMDREELRLRLRRYPDGPTSLSSVDRAHHRHPDLLPWPIKRGMRPPWAEIEPELEPITRAPADGVSGTQLALIDVVDPTGGKKTKAALVVRENGQVYARLMAAMTGMAATIVMMDGLDGKIDQIVHWCRFLLGRPPGGLF